MAHFSLFGAFFRALPAGIWGHCLQVLAFTSIWETPQNAKSTPFCPYTGLPLDSWRLSPPQGDREIVSCAVEREGSALEFASPAMQADREIVLAAVLEDAEALLSVSEELLLPQRGCNKRGFKACLASSLHANRPFPAFSVVFLRFSSLSKGSRST